MTSKGKILLIDDEPDIVDLIKHILVKEGYEVSEAYKGGEGLIKASSNNPDLVLVDIRLPDMDGNKLLKRIKENNPNQAVIMITAYADVDNAITSLKFGADDFIKKPFKNAHLVHIVNKSFEKKQILKEKKDLEKKYKRLVRDKHLRPKEKTVLYSLAKYPGLSDKEISKKIKMPRTTLTGIKNKLRKKNMYQRINTPNYLTLGFELLSAVTLEVNPASSHNLDVGKKLDIMGEDCLIYSQITDLEGFMVYMLRDYTQYKKHVEPRLNDLSYGNHLKSMHCCHFPLKISQITRFMDFSQAIRTLFNIKDDKAVMDSFMDDVKESRISNTEVKLIKALASNPEQSDAQIAERVSLSRARVSQIKKKLTEKGILKSMIYPKLGNIGAGLITVLCGDLKPNCAAQDLRRLREYIKSEPSSVFSISSDTEFLSINVLKDYEHYRSVHERIDDVGGKKENIVKNIKTTLLSVENIKSGRVDLASPLHNL